MSEAIKTERHGGVFALRLNRPDKRNALTLEMYGLLTEALQAAERDIAVRTVLLSGEGACFCAGNDLKDLIEGPSLEDPAHPTVRFVHALAAFGKPLVCAVHGPTVGIGATLLLHCDLVVAAEASTRLMLPFVSLGLVPEAGSTLLLPRLLGRQRAAELLLLGEALDARTAQSWGLVNRVVDDSDLMPEAEAIAAALAQRPPEALMRTKRLLRLDRDDTLGERMAVELREFTACLGGEEFTRAARAFLDKRR